MIRPPQNFAFSELVDRAHEKPSMFHTQVPEPRFQNSPFETATSTTQKIVENIIVPWCVSGTYFLSSFSSIVIIKGIHGVFKDHCFSQPECEFRPGSYWRKWDTTRSPLHWATPQVATSQNDTTSLLTKTASDAESEILPPPLASQLCSNFSKKMIEVIYSSKSNALLKIFRHFIDERLDKNTLPEILLGCIDYQAVCLQGQQVDANSLQTAQESQSPRLN